MRKLTIRAIAAIAARECGLHPREIHADVHEKRIVHVRQLAWWVAARVLKEPAQKIGYYLGGRDHSTVLHGLRAVEERLAADPELRARKDRILARIEAWKAGPEPACGTVTARAAPRPRERVTSLVPITPPQEILRRRIDRAYPEHAHGRGLPVRLAGEAIAGRAAAAEGAA